MAPQELEERREVKRAQIAAMLHANRKREARCRDIKQRLAALGNLEQVLACSEVPDMYANIGRDAGSCLHALSPTANCTGCLPQAPSEGGFESAEVWRPRLPLAA